MPAGGFGLRWRNLKLQTPNFKETSTFKLQLCDARSEGSLSGFWSAIEKLQTPSSKLQRSIKLQTPTKQFKERANSARFWSAAVLFRFVGSALLPTSLRRSRKMLCKLVAFLSLLALSSSSAPAPGKSALPNRTLRPRTGCGLPVMPLETNRPMARSWSYGLKRWHWKTLAAIAR